MIMKMCTRWRRKDEKIAAKQQQSRENKAEKKEKKVKIKMMKMNVESLRVLSLLLPTTSLNNHNSA